MNSIRRKKELCRNVRDVMSRNPALLAFSLFALALVFALSAAAPISSDSNKCVYWYLEKKDNEKRLHMCPEGCSGFNKTVIRREDVNSPEKILYLYCMIAKKVPSKTAPPHEFKLVTG